MTDDEYWERQRSLEHLTSEQCQTIHDGAFHAIHGHDQVSCWCCCMDCDFPADVFLARENDTP